jgi:predicted transcriptional regulator
MEFLIIFEVLVPCMSEDKQEGESDGSSLVSDLFMELASHARFLILMSLSRTPARMSSLAREFDTTVQEVYRNLNRMIKAELVRRHEGIFYITEYGRMVLNQISYFVFLKRYSAFLESHSLIESGIPSKFLHRIGSLGNCRIVNSETAVFQHLKKLESSADHTLKVMVAQGWPEEGQIFIEKAGAGVSIFLIVGHNTIIPKNVTERIGPSIEKLTSQGLFSRGMLEKVGAAVYIADNKQAALMFSGEKGEVDMSILLSSDDPLFCEWCSDLFDYFWQHSKPFDASKLKVVE